MNDVSAVAMCTHVFFCTTALFWMAGRCIRVSLRGTQPATFELERNVLLLACAASTVITASVIGFRGDNGIRPLHVVVSGCLATSMILCISEISKSLVTRNLRCRKHELSHVIDLLACASDGNANLMEGLSIVAKELEVSAPAISEELTNLQQELALEPATSALSRLLADHDGREDPMVGTPALSNQPLAARLRSLADLIRSQDCPDRSDSRQHHVNSSARAVPAILPGILARR